ncbi:MAG: Type 1 glutamine amidotransferase-like domain-containing protein [Candidatus Aenigmatarchaeota archaeon]
MKNLILAGGGSEKDSKPLDKLLVSLIPMNKKLLYIPVAMEPSKYPSCLKWFTSTFTCLGLTDIVMLTDLKEKIDLSQFGAIYMGGRNTFKLLHELRHSGFVTKLKKFLNMGGIIYGGSAGAIVLGKDIKTAFMDENRIGIRDTSGLNLVEGCSIWCHYKKEDDMKIFEYIGTNKIPVIALTERSGLYVRDKKIKVVGFEPIYVFTKNRKRVFRPKALVKL